METITVIKTDYSELEALIEKTYDRKYEIVAYEEANNYSSLSKDVKKNALDKYDIENIEKFKSGEIKFYILWSLMNDMCDLGVLQEGEYIVDIFW